MKSKFKLVGLSRTLSMTCEPLDKEECFWPKVGLGQDRFNALWEYWESGQKMICTIEHDGLDEDGIPINGTVIEVENA
jgi:hypothetical protein